MKIDKRISYVGDLGTVKFEEDGPDQAWDDVSGKALDAEAVRAARAEEMHFFQEFQVFCRMAMLVGY